MRTTLVKMSFPSNWSLFRISIAEVSGTWRCTWVLEMMVPRTCFHWAGSLSCALIPISSLPTFWVLLCVVRDIWNCLRGLCVGPVHLFLCIWSSATWASLFYGFVSEELQILPDSEPVFSGSSYPCASPAGLLLAKLQSTFKTLFLNCQDWAKK